jgi:protein-disulfide isomerase
VPVAAGGAIWAGLVLLLAAGMGKPGAARYSSVAGYIFVLATIGLAAVLYFGYASFFVLNRLCLLCLAVYVAVIGIFIVSGAAAATVSSLPSRVGGDLRTLRRSPAALALAAVWLVASVSVVAFFPREDLASAQPISTAPVAPVEELTADEIAQFEQWMAQQPRAQIDVPADGARVVVVKFNDYQCPACRQTYIAYKGLKEKWESQSKGQVRFISVDYPLEAECNTGGIHGAACEAAAAVRMARAKGRAEAMEEWLFDNQPRLTRDLVEEGVREVAQVTDFDEQYPKVLEQVRADTEKGHKLQIQGTPTFFINGIRIGGGLRASYFDAAIAYELKRAQGESGAP